MTCYQKLCKGFDKLIVYKYRFHMNNLLLIPPSFQANLDLKYIYIRLPMVTFRLAKFSFTYYINMLTLSYVCWAIHVF